MTDKQKDAPEAVRKIMEKFHEQSHCDPFAQNIPWHDQAFTREFTLLTDVRKQYWGSPASDVNRLEQIASVTDRYRPHVIDLCCGAGRHSIELAGRGYLVTGIDISSYAVRRARGKMARQPGTARFICADILSPPETDDADLIMIICEQITNFSPQQTQELIDLWTGRLKPHGALVIEFPTELPPLVESLYFTDQSFFIDKSCWVRYSQIPDPLERILMEKYTCLAEGSRKPACFFNWRKYYTVKEIAEMLPPGPVQVHDLPATSKRPEQQWVIYYRDDIAE